MISRARCVTSCPGFAPLQRDVHLASLDQCTALTGFARAHVIRFCFTLLLTSQRTLLLLHKERRHRSPWLTPADSCVSNDSEEEAQQGERRVIIPEPPGLELPGLPDFLFPRSVETEARVVQSGVIANAGSRLRPRHTEMKDMRLFEDIVSEEVSDKCFDQALVFFSVGTHGRREGKALTAWWVASCDTASRIGVTH